MLLLAGDIGGTKTILRLVTAEGDRLGKTHYEQSYASGNYPDLVPIVQQFLTEAESKVAETLAPEKACFAIAGPVAEDRCELTNLSWKLDARRLEAELEIPRISLINDFAAIGYGILGLSDEDLHCLQDVPANEKAPIAVLGAGTGMGQCFLVPAAEGWDVFPTEGGHASFAARNPTEFELSSYIRSKYELKSVSVERVVSGMGITAIYQFLRDTGDFPESEEIGVKVRTWESGNREIDTAALISKAALEGRDPLCQETLKIFVAAYGAEAGNLALKFLAYGGVYLAGGIAAKILPLMRSGEFMENFLAKGRMRSLLEKVPVNIILNPQVGLIGAAMRAEKL